MMDSLALDERAGKNRSENGWTDARLEPLDVHAAREIKQLLFRKTLDAKGVGGFLGKNEQHAGKVVLFQEALPRLEQAFFPTLIDRGSTCRTISPNFSPVAMPGRNFHDGRNTDLVRYPQGLQAVARPAVEKVVPSRREMPGCDPIKVFLFRS